MADVAGMRSDHSGGVAGARLERDAPAVARAYFMLQAIAGAAWWAAVFASDDVQRWTLGTWDPKVLVGPDLIFFAGASTIAAARRSRIAAVTAAGWTSAMTVALGIYGLAERAAGWGVVLMTLATVGSIASAATIWSGRLPTRWFFVGPFSFRVAAPATNGRNLGRSLRQLVVFWATFFGLVPALLTTVEARLRLDRPALDATGWTVGGAAAFVVGSALGLWACITMARHGRGTPLPAATARELVTRGPYGVVRNPMAVAGVLQTVGVGLAIGSWMVIASGLAGAIIWNVLIRPGEEADLAARFGEPYRAYARRVRCWVPARRAAAPSDRGGRPTAPG